MSTALCPLSRMNGIYIPQHSICGLPQMCVFWSGPPHLPIMGPDCSWGSSVSPSPDLCSQTLSAAWGVFSGFPGSSTWICICSRRSPPAQVLTWDSSNSRSAWDVPWYSLSFFLLNPSGVQTAQCWNRNSQSYCIFPALSFVCFPSTMLVFLLSWSLFNFSL